MRLVLYIQTPIYVLHQSLQKSIEYSIEPCYNGTRLSKECGPFFLLESIKPSITANGVMRLVKTCGVVDKCERLWSIYSLHVYISRRHSVATVKKQIRQLKRPSGLPTSQHVSNINCSMAVRRYLCHAIWLMWQYSHGQGNTVVTDGPVPNWRKDICNHHDGIAPLVYITGS